MNIEMQVTYTEEDIKAMIAANLDADDRLPRAPRGHRWVVLCDKYNHSAMFTAATEVIPEGEDANDANIHSDAAVS